MHTKTRYTKAVCSLPSYNHPLVHATAHSRKKKHSHFILQAHISLFTTKHAHMHWLQHNIVPCFAKNTKMQTSWNINCTFFVYYWLVSSLHYSHSFFHTTAFVPFFDFDVLKPSQTGGAHTVAEALLIFFGHSSLSAAVLISSHSN